MSILLGVLFGVPLGLVFILELAAILNNVKRTEQMREWAEQQE